MTADLFDPPELRLADDVVARRRAHLLAEIEPAVRRLRLIVPAAAVAIVAVAVVLLVGHARTTKLTLVDQALAAIGSGPTIHVVLEVPNAAQLLDVKTGKTRSLSSRVEFWADPKLGTIFIRTLGNHVAQRQVFPRSAWRGAAAEWRPFVVGYQKQLASGAFHVVSQGRSVEWIGNGDGEQIAISKTTYKPLAIRYRKRGRQTEARVIVAESTPRRPSLFAHVEKLGTFDGGMTSVAQGTSSGTPTTLAAARTAMTPDPVVPDRTIDGLKRSWIGLPNYLLPPGNSYKDQVEGLTLYYGRLDGYGYPRWAGRYVAINEIPSRHDADVIWGAGFFHTGTAVLVTPVGTGETTATFELKGLYIAIQASDRAGAVAAVHALAAGR